MESHYVKVINPSKTQELERNPVSFTTKMMGLS